MGTEETALLLHYRLTGWLGHLAAWRDHHEEKVAGLFTVCEYMTKLTENAINFFPKAPRKTFVANKRDIGFGSQKSPSNYPPKWSLIPAETCQILPKAGKMTAKTGRKTGLLASEFIKLVQLRRSESSAKAFGWEGVRNASMV